MTLYADITVSRDAGFRLGLELEVAAGEAVALVGPNGAGKTTALRALAGLVGLTQGHIAVDDEVFDDAASTFVPPERRPIGVVFQDYLLFPHLSVRANVAFGLRTRGVDRHTARHRAQEWLDRVGLGEYARKRPRTLSGGEAQRVALARALVTQPRMLLLDEPLAALDASTRIQIRSELRRHLADYQGTTVLVTHDPLDAMVLADRLLVLEDGVVVQHGTPVEIAERPRTDYVAQLVGLNLYRGSADESSIELDDGGLLVSADGASGDVLIAFPPSAVSVHSDQPHGSPRNTWPVEVISLEEYGSTTRVRLSGKPEVLADVTPSAVAELDLAPGSALWAQLKATEIRTYPA